MSTTDFKPGDIVQHPEYAPGLVARRLTQQIGVYYAQRDEGSLALTSDLTGWERVETCTRSERQWLDYRGGVQCTCDHYPETTNGPEEDCAIHGRPYEEWVKRAIDAKEELARIEAVRPGHVQARVDDLGTVESHWLNENEDTWNFAGRVAIRAANAISAQRAESTPPADEQTTSTTVTLPCPDCGEAITRTAQVWTGSQRDRCLTWATLGWHTCPPAQPDEPTEFGARIVVTDDLSGAPERWCRQHDGDWANADDGLATWAYLTQRGTVTLGWDE